MAGQRVTQSAQEALAAGIDTKARVTNTALEALLSDIDTYARVTGIAIEVLLDPDAVTGFPWVNLPRAWLGAAVRRSPLAPPAV